MTPTPGTHDNIQTHGEPCPVCGGCDWVCVEARDAGLADMMFIANGQANDLIALREQLAASEQVRQMAERLNKTYREGLLDENGLVLKQQARIEALESAARDALSDFEWAEKTLPGTNFQASILKLRHALKEAP